MDTGLLWEHTPYLMTLDLSFNKLSSLPDGSFANLRGMRSLNVSNNALSRIGDGGLFTDCCEHLEEL